MGLMELYEECLLWSDSAADGVDPGYTLDAVDVAFGRLTTVAFQEIVVLKGAAWNPGGDPFWGETCLSGVWVRENSWTPWTARVPPHLFSPPTPRLPIESCSSPPPHRAAGNCSARNGGAADGASSGPPPGRRHLAHSVEQRRHPVRARLQPQARMSSGRAGWGAWETPERWCSDELAVRTPLPQLSPWGTGGAGAPAGFPAARRCRPPAFGAGSGVMPACENGAATCCRCAGRSSAWLGRSWRPFPRGPPSSWQTSQAPCGTSRPTPPRTRALVLGGGWRAGGWRGEGDGAAGCGLRCGARQTPPSPLSHWHTRALQGSTASWGGKLGQQVL